MPVQAGDMETGIFLSTKSAVDKKLGAFAPCQIIWESAYANRSEFATHFPI